MYCTERQSVLYVYFCCLAVVTVQCVQTERHAEQASKGGGGGVGGRRMMIA